MEILKGILVILHLLAFGLLFGTTVAQFKFLKDGTAKISNGMLHSATALLVTGLALIGTIYAMDGQPNNAKIAVKLVVLLIIFGLIIFNRKKNPVPPYVFGLISAFVTVNVMLAILW